MQQFNKISVYSNVIKNLLASTYLPLVRSVREGDYICEGNLYILRCEVIKCTSSGYIGYKGFINNVTPADWEYVQEFHFGDKDGKLSTNYISNAEGYDYKTHERFGQYLRNLRDMYGLNLMPLYNCFSNQPLENHIIRNNMVEHTSADNNTKIYKIPIRFNQDYTLCIENLGKTTIAPAFIRYNTLLAENNTIYGNGIDMTNQYISLHNGDNISTYINTSFKKPIKFRFNNRPETKSYSIQSYDYIESDDGYPILPKPTKVSYEITPEVVSQYDKIEDHLYVLIQVPKVFNQNIVLLEGDYTHLESQKIVDYLKIERLPDFLYDKYYIHDLNLMSSTSKEPRPFSPILVEFILWNAISTLDTINNDLDRLSISLGSQYIPRSDDIKGELPNFWVPRYRQLVSDFIYGDTHGVVQDNLGYVTKDVEKYIESDVLYRGTL